MCMCVYVCANRFAKHDHDNRNTFKTAIKHYPDTHTTQLATDSHTTHLATDYQI